MHDAEENDLIMLKNENIICASWVDWDFIPLIMHHMMRGLAKHNRVLYIDPVIALSSFLTYQTGRPYLREKMRKWRGGIKQVEENIYIYYPPPILVQYGHSKLNDRINQIYIGRAIRRVAVKLGFTSPILWFYNPHIILPGGTLGEKLVCYDCNDDMSSFLSRHAHKKRGLDTLERRFTVKADIVFTTSKTLYEAKKKINLNTYYFPSGVDFELFHQAIDPSISIPDDIGHLPCPVIGYIGAITNSKIDWEYLIASSRLHPEWSFALIGPCLDPPPEEILNLKNIHFLGQKSPETLPGYVKAFDVCIIPYKGKEFLESCFPTKSFEYFAAGKPVVSSYIPALEEFRHIIRLSKNKEEFVHHIEEILKIGREENFVRECISVARGMTWENRLEKTGSLIEKILKEKFK